MTIKPWADRLIDNEVKGATVAMLAEIDELRAKLAELENQPAYGTVVFYPNSKHFFLLDESPYFDNAIDHMAVYLAAGAKE